MRRFLIGTALALLGLVPAIGSACEYHGASSASATPPAQIGKASPPSASTVPVVAKAPVLEVAKEVADKATPPSENAQVAKVATTN